MVYGVFVLVTAVFVGSTTYQVAVELFGNRSAIADAPRVGGACAAGLRALATAIDPVLSTTQRAADRDEAKRLYDAAKQPVWQHYPDVARACEAEPNGPDALAALLRFDRAAEGVAFRTAVDLARVRREVDSFIR